MGKLEQVEAVRAVFEVVGPLFLGILTGALQEKYVYPRIVERLGGLAKWLSTPANVFLGVLIICVYLAVAVACHASNAPETLAWLQAHAPFRPPPGSLRIAFFAATFLCGHSLVMLGASPAEEGDRLPADPRGGRRG